MYFHLFSMLKIHHKSQNSGIFTVERIRCCWVSYCILVWVPEPFLNTVLLEAVHRELQELFESKKKMHYKIINTEHPFQLMHKVPRLQIKFTFWGRNDKGKGLVNSCTSHHYFDDLICLMVVSKSEMGMQGNRKGLMPCEGDHIN